MAVFHPYVSVAWIYHVSSRALEPLPEVNHPCLRGICRIHRVLHPSSVTFGDFFVARFSDNLVYRKNYQHLNSQPHDSFLKSAFSIQNSRIPFEPQLFRYSWTHLKAEVCSVFLRIRRIPRISFLRQSMMSFSKLRRHTAFSLQPTSSSWVRSVRLIWIRPLANLCNIFWDTRRQHYISALPSPNSSFARRPYQPNAWQPLLLQPPPI